MLKQQKIFLAVVAMACANFASAQSSAVPQSAPMTAPKDPINAAPSPGAQSNDPYIQRREARKQAKKEYKATKKAAKQEYKADKRQANEDLKAARQANDAGQQSPATSGK